MMNRSKHEWNEESYERFLNGGSEFDGEDGSEAFEADAQIRRGFQEYPVPRYDSNDLARKMFESAGSHSTLLSFFTSEFLWNRAPAYASGLVIVVCTFLLAFQFLSIQSEGVEIVRFYDNANQGEHAPSWLWKTRLRMGNLVTVPRDAAAEFKLMDGSTVDAPGGSQIAIEFERERRIYFNRGKLKVHAATDKSKPMIVRTPLADVVVTGTVFEVELVP